MQSGLETNSLWPIFVTMGLHHAPTELSHQRPTLPNQSDCTYMDIDPKPMEYMQQTPAPTTGNQHQLLPPMQHRTTDNL